MKTRKQIKLIEEKEEVKNVNKVIELRRQLFTIHIHLEAFILQFKRKKKYTYRDIFLILFIVYSRQLNNKKNYSVFFKLFFIFKITKQNKYSNIFRESEGYSNPQST
jgi:hypothetical protein